MNKIIWVNLLHFYQPPTADNQTVIEAAEKSYKKIIDALKNNPHIKFTLNLTGCLLEKLAGLGYHDLMADLRMLSDRKQIELTGTAAFHPILPLLPDEEVKNNIKINQAILKKYFGENHLQTQGFFLPELAYNQKVAKIIASLGYSWIILDEISAYGKLNQLDYRKLYLEEDTGLKIFFRSRKLSKSYVPETIFNLIDRGYDGLALTATDAELYGLRHHDDVVFKKLMKRPEIETLTVNEFLSSLKEEIKIKPLASSWESTASELKSDQPFILWHNNKNKIQKLLWQLATLAITTLKQYPTDVNYSWARTHLNRGLASCTFWWASARDFKLFSSISWNPDEIERGINELIKSIRSLAEPNTKATKIAAEKLHLKIKQAIWHKHWNHYWKK